MSDNDIKLWKYAAMVAVAIAALITGSCKVTQYNVVRLVEQGHSPIEAACAISVADAGPRDVLCMEALRE